MTMHVAGYATATPPRALQLDQGVRLAHACNCTTDRERRLVTALYRRSNVRTRGSVLLGYGNGSSGGRNQDDLHAFYGRPAAGDGHGPTVAQRMRTYAEHALPLARTTAGQAIERAGLTPDRIDHLITVSCTGFSAPGLDVHLIKDLRLRPDVGRTMIGFMGCHGAINGLRVASALPGSAVLLCAVELCTLHFQYGWDPQQIVSNALFADGAAALVGTARTRHGAPRLVATGSCVLPDSLDDMTWTVGNHGFAMTLSPRVPALIRTHLRPWLTSWLDERGYAIDAVDGWAIHPGGPRIISAVESALALPRGAGDLSREVLAECGNMSSPTVLFLLERLWQQGRRPVVALAFGPGLVAEAALFD
jgi:predicted naringenin-chalcone synthase